jgi:hypothetical protein
VQHERMSQNPAGQYHKNWHCLDNFGGGPCREIANIWTFKGAAG